MYLSWAELTEQATIRHLVAFFASKASKVGNQRHFHRNDAAHPHHDVERFVALVLSNREAMKSENLWLAEAAFEALGATRSRAIIRALEQNNQDLPLIDPALLTAGARGAPWTAQAEGWNVESFLNKLEVQNREKRPKQEQVAAPSGAKSKLIKKNGVP